MTYGIHPFWFWNGDMDEETIKVQIQRMDEQGITGFVLCARQGLTIPYLSQKWFDRVRVAIEEAKKREMLVWLYDEQPYPSGISGGKVVLDHPEFEAKHIVPHIYMQEVKWEEEHHFDLEWGRPLYAKAFQIISEEDPINLNEGIDIQSQIGSLFREEVYHEVGLTAYNRKRFLACDAYYQLDLQVPKGLYKIVVFMEVPLRGHKYYDYFVDPMNPEAVDYFIETTHELYKKQLGEYFGATVQGFFTDEIHPTGYEDRLIPWSPRMPEIYRERTGRNLLEELPALILDSHEDAATIRYDFYDCLVEGFIESYDKKVQKWCHENKLKYIGEKPILRSHQLAYMDIPGIDAGHQKVGTKPEMFSGRYRANGKIAASATHFYQKESALCESFHSIGWGMEIQDMKWTYDWLFLQGITLFINHAYYGNAQGLAKHDAPPSGFFQMPWYQHQKHLSRYVQTIASAMQGGRRHIQLVLIDPITTTWTYKTKKERENRLELFEQLQQRLFQAGYDFYIMDPSLLEDCVKVNEGLRHGEEMYKLVVDTDKLSLDEIIKHCIGLKIPRLQVLHQGRRVEGLYAVAWEKSNREYQFLVNTGVFQGKVQLINQEGHLLNTMNLQPFESILIIDGHVNQTYTFDEQVSWVFDSQESCRFELAQENVLRIDAWDLRVEGQCRSVKAKPIIDQLEEGGFMLPVKRHDQFGTSKQLLFSEIQARYTTQFILENRQALKLRIEKKGIRGQWSIGINGHYIAQEKIIRDENLTEEGYELPITSYLLQGLNRIEIKLEAKHSWDGVLVPIYLIGRFSVQYKDEKYVLASEKTQGKFADYQTMGIPHYAGDIIYEYTYTSQSKIQWFRIDNPAFQQSATLRVNNQDIETKAFAPYIWDVRKAWKIGKNKVEIIASTTRLGYYENQYYRPNREPQEAYKAYERNKS
jgi:hypothetical protein